MQNKPTSALAERLAAGGKLSGPVLVVAAHPDDESIGAGTRFARLDGRPAFVHVTDGSPRDLSDARRAGFATRENYARARRRELSAALAAGGLEDPDLRELGRVDQEAAFDLAGLARELAGIFRELRPKVVLAHPFEGGHPDHDAAAFAVHAARRLLETDGLPAPAVVEFACYYQPADGGIVLGDFLPTAGAPPVWTAPLSDAERERKRRVLAAHRSQWHLLQGWPLDCERFRAAPDYDFTRPAHPVWPPLYEKFGWGGLTAARWCALAAEALAGLGLAGE